MMVSGTYKYTETEEKQLLSSIVILIDTREQKNEHIVDYFTKHKIPFKKKALSHGDYSFYLPKNDELSIFRDIYFDNEIIVERKANLNELSNNFSNERNRFEEEFAISKAHKKYLLIENANYSDVVQGNYDTKYNKKSFIGSLHSFNHKYDLEIVFIPDCLFTPIYIYGTMQYYLRNKLKS